MQFTEAQYEVSASGCWLWLGQVSEDGYGVIGEYPPLYQGVHRISYENTYGPVPPGLIVDHACHSQSECDKGKACEHRRCLNPDHLRAITRSQNSKLRYKRELV